MIVEHGSIETQLFFGGIGIEICANTLQAVQDLIGDGFTLLRLGRTAVDTSGLERAMRASATPFEVMMVNDDVARDIYGYDLILLRPDMHVAWRGNRAPEDPAGLAALVTGN